VSNLQAIPIVKLADVRSGGAAPQDPSAFSREGHPFVRAGSLSRLLGGDDENQLEKILPEVARSHRLQLFPKGTVLFAKSGMSATKGYIYNLKQPAYVVSHLAALVPHDPRDSAFLTRALQRFSPTSLVKDQAYPSIRLGDIEQMEILAPDSIEDRGRIATLLDMADALRHKRKNVIDLLDALTRSLFLEMFGNPESNPKGWKWGRISDLLEGVQYGTSEKAGDRGTYPILRMGNLGSDGRMDFEDLKYIDLHAKDLDKFTLRRGDILFNRTNSAELVGKTAVFDRDEPFVFAGYLVRARVRSGVSPYYISGYLNSRHGKATLRGMAKSIVGMANINAKEMQAIPILLPDVKTQGAYSEGLSSIERLRSECHRNLKSLNSLFSSLQQRAFSGELG